MEAMETDPNPDRVSGENTPRTPGHRCGATEPSWVEQVFVTCTSAVNATMARASLWHGGRPCPATRGTAAGPDPRRTVLACCDLGCFDDAVDVLAGVVEKITAAGWLERSPARSLLSDDDRHRTPQEAALYLYAARTAAAVLGEMHRYRRRNLGLPQRPERVSGADWANRLFPDPADRELLVHLLTWLGSDGSATGEPGWPLQVWAERHGLALPDMARWVARVVSVLREEDPRRYQRYIAGPLAAKPRATVPFSAVELVDGHPVRRQRHRYTAAPGLWEDRTRTGTPMAVPTKKMTAATKGRK